jgi:hypothetical protein|tara:strand:- start:3092 stop:3460 length:369 start_codon:yes stop_codon:yes gene_type:complete
MSKGIPKGRKFIYSIFFALALGLGGFGYHQSVQKPELPITLKYRDSVFGKGYVAQFHNTSERHLKIKVTISSETTGEEKEGILDIAPTSIKEIGWAEGWQFSSGESVKVFNAAYKQAEYSIP